jgi:lycopene cyclase domain-containing protein
MMQWAYFIGLAVSISGLVALDRKFTLAFFHNFKRTAITLAVAIWLFIVWDIFGIYFGIFFHGDSAYSLPYRIIPELPVEEILFLFLLTYVTLLIYRFVEKRRA